MCLHEYILTNQKEFDRRKNILASRDSTIDILRTIGLLGIILAHVSPPLLIKSVRSFDVPLMVIVSGFAYSSSSSSTLNFFNYYKKRLLRLIIPVWSFLIIFFLFFYTVDLLTGNDSVTISKILRSFMLLNKGGIGYVWIIRVFVTVAILAPLLKKIELKTEKNRWYYLFIAVVFYCYSYLAEISYSSYNYATSNIISITYNEYIMYAVPYSLFFLLGIIVKKITNKYTLCTISTILFFILMVSLSFSNLTFYEVNSFKYPPRYIWLIYGITVSLSLYVVISLLHFPDKFMSMIIFVSSSSMWIYLWHIFILQMWGYGIRFIPNIINSYIIKFLIVTLISIFIVYIQKKFIVNILHKHHVPKSFENFLEIAFLK